MPTPIKDDFSTNDTKTVRETRRASHALDCEKGAPLLAPPRAPAARNTNAMASTRMPPPSLLHSLLANAATREFLGRRAIPAHLPYPATTLPFSKRLLCVPLSTPPVICGVVVTDSLSGYAFCVMEERQKVVVIVGECRDGIEVVVLHQGDTMMTRFEGNTFQKFIAGGEVLPGLPGDCARRIPNCTDQWCMNAVDESTNYRVRKWVASAGRTACPVALLNGKVRMCRGLAVWELLSGNDVPEQKPQRRLVRLAPAPQPGAGGVVKEVSSEGEEKRRKAELRKARNRESAQRSNMRRKMKLQALKEELERISLREKRLRKREKDLRAENSELRTVIDG